MDYRLWTVDRGRFPSSSPVHPLEPEAARAVRDEREARDGPARVAQQLRSFPGETQTGTFARVEPFTPSRTQLRACTAAYASEELNVEWHIVERDSTLMIQRPANADTVVQPLATDMFTTIGDFMRFSRTAKHT